MFYNLIWWLFAIPLLCTIAEVTTAATVTASNSRHRFNLCTLQPDITSHDQTTQPISTLSFSRIQSIILLFSRNIIYLNCKVVVWAPHPPSISFFFFFFRDVWHFGKEKMVVAHVQNRNEAICSHSRVIKQHSSDVLIPSNDLLHYNSVVNKGLYVRW